VSENDNNFPNETDPKYPHIIKPLDGSGTTGEKYSWFDHPDKKQRFFVFLKDKLM
jgi:hypothetical protein